MEYQIREIIGAVWTRIMDDYGHIDDAAPIISLMKAGQLELLQKLFGTVCIPKAA